MARIPKEAFGDPTLQAVGEQIEKSGNAEPARPYLGASAIGGPCERKLWYSFRWAFREWFDETSLRRFDDGHRGEDIMAARLRAVDGIELHTSDPRTGGQFLITAFGSHFQGHMDGAIHGLYQAPKTWHVWEHKCTNEKKQGELEKLKIEKGEKHALESWDVTYHGQAQIYMKLSGMKRHYLTCSSPGERSTISCRTDYVAKHGKELLEKAGRIIGAPEPPPKLSNKPEYYLCGPKWCSFRGICHEGALPAVNCRTCMHSTPIGTDSSASPNPAAGGRWSCALAADADIPLDVQRTGCPSHLYIPTLLPFKCVDASETERWVEYEVDGGGRFRNGPAPAGHSSEEIRCSDTAILVDQITSYLKNDSRAPWSAPESNEPSQDAKPVWSAASTAPVSSPTPPPEGMVPEWVLAACKTEAKAPA